MCARCRTLSAGFKAKSSSGNKADSVFGWNSKSFHHSKLPALDSQRKHATVSSANLAAINDGDSSVGLAALRTKFLDGFHNILTTENFSKDDVLAIEPWACDRCNEELRSVGVSTSIGHRQQERGGVFFFEVLILEFHAIDRFAASTISACEVTTLKLQKPDVNEGMAKGK